VSGEGALTNAVIRENRNSQKAYLRRNRIDPTLDCEQAVATFRSRQLAGREGIF
jgi:hypothetical protein